MEEKLWESGLLGDHNLQMLWHNPSQLSVFDKEGTALYIQYHKDISNTNQGRLKSQKFIPKHVIYPANTENSSWCLVRLFLEYTELCPYDCPDSAL